MADPKDLKAEPLDPILLKAILNDVENQSFICLFFKAFLL
jgi:hypothetical protein